MFEVGSNIIEEVASAAESLSKAAPTPVRALETSATVYLMRSLASLRRRLNRSSSPGQSHWPFVLLLSFLSRPQHASNKRMFWLTGFKKIVGEFCEHSRELDEVRRLYDGRVVTAHDLDVF
jgi:hypothetical protein